MATGVFARELLLHQRSVLGISGQAGALDEWHLTPTTTGQRAESKRALIPIREEGVRGDDSKSRCRDRFPRYFLFRRACMMPL